MNHEINPIMLAISYIRAVNLDDQLAAKLIVGHQEEAEQLTGTINTVNGGMFTRNVVVRTQFFNQILIEQSSRFEQLLVLGIGLDTKYDTIDCLNNKPVYAIDLAAEEIKECYVRANIKMKNKLVAGDLTKISQNHLLDMLIATGFDCRKKTFVVWEGGTFYLKSQDIWQVLSYLDTQINLIDYVMDCLNKAIFIDEKHPNSQMIKEVLTILAESHNPWTGFLSIEEIEQFCAEEKFEKVSIIEHGEVEKQLYQELIVIPDLLYFVLALK